MLERLMFERTMKKNLKKIIFKWKYYCELLRIMNYDYKLENE